MHIDRRTCIVQLLMCESVDKMSNVVGADTVSPPCRQMTPR